MRVSTRYTTNIQTEMIHQLTPHPHPPPPHPKKGNFYWQQMLSVQSAAENGCRDEHELPELRNLQHSLLFTAQQISGPGPSQLDKPVHGTDGSVSDDRWTLPGYDVVMWLWHIISVRIGKWGGGWVCGGGCGGRVRGAFLFDPLLPL